MVEEVVQTPDEATQEGKLWALLSYVVFPPLFGIIALLMEDKKNQPFIRYNAWVSIVLGVLIWLLSWACIGFIIWIYAIYLGIQSYQGKWVEVPFISDFVRNQGWA